MLPRRSPRLAGLDSGTSSPPAKRQKKAPAKKTPGAPRNNGAEKRRQNAEKKKLAKEQAVKKRQSTLDLKKNVSAAVEDGHHVELRELLSVDPSPRNRGLKRPSMLQRLNTLIYSSCGELHDDYIECYRTLLDYFDTPLTTDEFKNMRTTVVSMTNLLQVVADRGLPADLEHMVDKGVIYAARHGDHRALEWLLKQTFYNINRFLTTQYTRTLHLVILRSIHRPKMLRAVLNAPDVMVNMYHALPPIDPQAQLEWHWQFEYEGEIDEELHDVDDLPPFRCMTALEIVDYMYTKHIFTPPNVPDYGLYEAKCQMKRFDAAQMRMLLGHDDIDIHTLKRPGAESEHFNGYRQPGLNVKLEKYDDAQYV